MPPLTVSQTVGTRVEGVFTCPLPPLERFDGYQVLVQLSGIGLVPLELADPDAPPPLHSETLDLGTLTFAPEVEAAIGHRVVDVIVSKYLASVSLVLDDASILTNDVQEFSNEATIKRAGYLPRNDYFSRLSDPKQ